MFLKSMHTYRKLFLIAMIAFLATGFLSALPAMFAGVKNFPALSGSDFLNGNAAARFEKTFKSSHPFLNTAQFLWSAFEWNEFHDGRDGVLIGDTGWLFSTEEFTGLGTRNDHSETHFNFIADAAAALKDQNIRLVIALIPSKARLFADKLGRHTYPQIHGAFYDAALARFKTFGISAPDLRPALGEEDDFLKTDTHWSPEGARDVAQLLAPWIKHNSFQSVFQTKTLNNSEFYQGDLTRYAGGHAYAPETITAFETYPLSAAQDLFSDQTFPITLVGTSYSANPLWHFEGHLKTALSADILNVSDKGLGPFAVMHNWMRSDDFKSYAPALVIWEIPERYLWLPDQILKGTP